MDLKQLKSRLTAESSRNMKRANNPALYEPQYLVHLKRGILRQTPQRTVYLHRIRLHIHLLLSIEKKKGLIWHSNLIVGLSKINQQTSKHISFADAGADFGTEASRKETTITRAETVLLNIREGAISISLRKKKQNLRDFI